MPPRGPSAAFSPIPPDLDLAALVESTPNFEYVTRVSCEMVEQQSSEAFEKLVLLHVIIGGKPLVIDGFEKRLDGWTFERGWLMDNCGSKFEQARNLTKGTNMPLSIGHYLNNMGKLTDQWTRDNYTETDRQRIYLKDIDCPQLWHDKLEQQTPASIFYLNDSTGDLGGPGAREANQKGIARCGDLMSCLPLEMRAENMMCYIGHEGTYTPAHREMCASLGHNLMAESSGHKDHEGKPTKPGSSIWFMTETKDRHLVSEYWLSTLGHDIEVEKHFAQIAAWKHAPFTTYIVEQKAGDFILIPPLAPHQVWNRGTRTMKVAWNRTTVETLEMALHEALPRARMVCRDEQYKNKAMIYFTLQKYSGLIADAELQKQSERNPVAYETLKYSTKIKQLQKDFKRLFALFTEILLSEMLAPVSPSDPRGQYLPFESFITCSYCRCNIFNRFLTCMTCTEPLPNGEEDTYDICMDCFAMGRSCSCISHYKWVEQFPWQELIQKHEQWRQQIITSEGGVNKKSPISLQAERKAMAKKTLAQVCQEQLKLRPWSDPNNPLQGLTMAQKREISRGGPEANGEDELDDDGNPKKKTKGRRSTFMEKAYNVEHVSLHPEEKWKLATCSKCDRSYSYGSLWRMFDLMPLTVMENPQWKCPFCLRICSCGACRKKGSMKPYEPQGTILGHDTKAVADRRSMEHLVDFSHSNMRWITAVGDDDPHDSRRLNRRRQEAEIAKSQDPTLDDNYIDQQDDSLFIQDNSIDKEPMESIDQTIDPALLTISTSPANRRAPPNSSAARRSQGSPAQTQVSATGTSTGNDHYTGQDTLANGSLDHATSFVSNGITYEYPDPTDPQHMPFNQTLNSPSTNRLIELSERQLKLKRKAELSLIQTDAAPEAPIASANQVSQHQANQSLQQAKENDRYTMAEAALTGKSLIVSLPISGPRLAAIDNKTPSSAPTKPPTTRIIHDLLQSDLPEDDANNSKRKKAKHTAEADSEFRIRARWTAPATATAATKTNRNTRTSYAEADSDTSEDEDVVMKDAVSSPPTTTTTGKTPGPRLLPGYLAQRHKGLGLPDELPAEEPRRKSSSSAAAAVPKKSPPIVVSHPTATSTPNSAPPVKRGRGRPPKDRSSLDNHANLSPAEKLAEANRRAKAKAVSWADSNGIGDDDSASSSSSAANDDDDTSDKSPEKNASDDDASSSDVDVLRESSVVARKRGRPPGGAGRGTGGGGGEPAPPGEKLMAVPMSMFERKRFMGKKVRVASAKTAAGAAA